MRARHSRWTGPRRASGAVPLLSFLLAVAILPCAGTPVAAQDARVLTAEESVRRGLEHSARVREARAGADAARAVWQLERAELLPDLVAEASFTRLSDDVVDASFMIPGLDTALTLLPVERDRTHTELRLEQPLFAGFRLRNQARAAAHAADAAALAAEQASADVALEIRHAYWGLHEAAAVLEATETALAQVERHLQDVRNRVEAGAALPRDLLAAETRHGEVLLERVEAENALRVGRLELNRLVGLPLDTPVEPADEVAPGEALPPAEDLETITARAIEGRPEILGLERDVLAARARAAAARGHWLPHLALVARYVYARPNAYFFTEQDRFHSNWEVGVSARWGIFEGGRRPALAREADASLEQAEARLAGSREAAVVEVARQYLEVRRAAEALEVAGRAVRSAEESFRVARAQFTEGAALSADVLDAEQASRSARARRARAGAEYAVARARLLNAEGRVW
jgi:outer membrane protein TolC